MKFIINYMTQLLLRGVQRFGNVSKKIDDQQTLENMFNVINTGQMQAIITENFICNIHKHINKHKL